MTIKTIADALLEERATVNSLAQSIGTNLKMKSAGSGYDLTPSDTRFGTAFIRIETPAEGGARGDGETPIYVELTVAGAVEMRLKELSELFGAWKRVPPPPHGDPYRVVYYYDSSTSDYEAVITATLTSQPGDPQARVKKITMRREMQPGK